MGRNSLEEEDGGAGREKRIQGKENSVFKSPDVEGPLVLPKR